MSELEYVIPTLEVDPDLLDKLDTQNSSREKDAQTIKMPSMTNTCPIQLWEVYTCVAILLMQPPSKILTAHVKALCEHNEPRFLCEAILKEHTTVGTVTDVSQDVTLYSFLEEYFLRKFQIQFTKSSLFKYVADVLDDPLCGKLGIPRIFLISFFTQALLLNTQFFEGQYDELVDGMRLVHLPVNDMLADESVEIGDAVGINWDNVKMYDDPNLILKKYGGWAITKGARMLTPKDQLCMRLTGCTLEQLLKGDAVPDSPREDLHMDLALGLANDGGKPGSKVNKRGSAMRRRSTAALGAVGKSGDAAGKDGEDALGDDDTDSSHPSDFEVDPEHSKVVPIGITLSEAYVLVRGLLVSQESSHREWRSGIVGQQLTRSKRDGHVIAAAVLVDLYMREQIDVMHWTLTEGNIAAAYKLRRKEGLPLMDHFLDEYSNDAETIFRDMRLPSNIGEEPIWANLEARGVLSNHHPSWQRGYGCGYTRVDVWDFARPDILLDLKEGYLTAARVLYDKHFSDPMEEKSNDMLMFMHLLQTLFDQSFEAIDGLARVLKERCPPFEKGELFAPVSLVHSGAVCMGLIDRAFLIGNCMDTNLAQEAAEFNQLVMERLEEKFFLSANIWQSFDVDQSGELTMEEFVEGMRGIDVYKDFRRERVPENVLRMIVSDLAERLFQEVDINMDGSLTQEELQAAFRRRREDALKQRDRREWLKRLARGVAQQVGVWKQEEVEEDLMESAKKVQQSAMKKTREKEQQRAYEWSAEVDRIELLDEDVDVDTGISING